MVMLILGIPWHELATKGQNDFTRESKYKWKYWHWYIQTPISKLSVNGSLTIDGGLAWSHQQDHEMKFKII